MVVADKCFSSWF